MIRKCGFKDSGRIFYVINEAAKAYRGVIPKNCYHEPYMPVEELLEEMKAVTFFGYERDNQLIGVMGLQILNDVTLIRHSYVLPKDQHMGVGSKLLNRLISIATTKRILVGTWRGVEWAIRFYEENGFKILLNKDVHPRIGLLCHYLQLVISPGFKM